MAGEVRRTVEIRPAVRIRISPHGSVWKMILRLTISSDPHLETSLESTRSMLTIDVSAASTGGRDAAANSTLFSFYDH